MAQFDFGNLSSPLSGAALIDDNLEPWRDALHSSHSGTAAPGYIVAGMLWVNTNTTPWVIGMYDGGQTVALGTLNPSTHAFKPSVSGLAGDVTNAMLAAMAANTVKVNNTGSSAVPTDVSMGSSTILARLATGSIVAASTTQIVTLLNVPTLGASNVYVGAQSSAPVSLTSTSNSIAVDLSLGNNFAHTFTENTTLANPTNVTAGQSGQITFTQHASSAKTIAFGSNWKEVAGQTPTASTTTSAQNILSWYAADSTHIWFSYNKNGIA